MESRRNFLKKALYVSPIILSVAVRPARASTAYGGNGGSVPTNVPRSSAPASSGGHRHSSSPWWAFWRHM